jgi:hypothetical protein
VGSDAVLHVLVARAAGQAEAPPGTERTARLIYGAAMRGMDAAAEETAPRADEGTAAPPQREPISREAYFRSGTEPGDRVVAFGNGSHADDRHGSTIAG